MSEEQGGTIAGLPPWALVVIILSAILLALGILNIQRLLDVAKSIVAAIVSEWSKIVSGAKIPGV